MAAEIRRKTPEEYLRECQAEEAAAIAEHKRRLKIFLGYASGVGKSYRMLDEARRRRERGEDVIIGAMQPQVPEEVAPLLEKLEVIPLKAVGRGTAVDVEALIRRGPATCIIDGLAYDNPPGVRNATRWQDVQDLLDAGIHVIASINIQYIAELSEQVEAITGKHVDQTVPLSFIRNADEIEIVDAPPEEPIERSPGDEKREERLSKLRELALVVTADLVDDQLNDYLERNGIEQKFGTHERILVCVTPWVNLQEMMEFAQIIVKRFHGELFVAYVKQARTSAKEQAALDLRLATANAAGAHVEILEGDSSAKVLLAFARSRGITQIFVGHSRRTGLDRLRGSPLDELIWKGRGIDVCVFPQ